MELEDQIAQRTGERCQECGTPLTEDELREVILGGGPPLCKIHAAEEVPVAEEEDAFGDSA